MPQEFSGSRFEGDIKVDVDNYDEEYVRLAKFLDKFLPKEDVIIKKVELSDNTNATYESIEVISKLIEEGKKDWIVRRTAEKIVQYIPWKDYKREVNAVYNFVVRRLRYTKDIHNVETVHRARDLLRFHLKAGDCDDFVILTGALLQSIGHPVRIVIIGNNPSNKNDFSHIYLQVKLKDKWIGLDGSVPGAKVGWEAPRFSTKKIINLDGTGSISVVKKSSRIILWIMIGIALINCYNYTQARSKHGL